jgi:beta-lactamase superfamily II metal-dependent hydrolase
MMSVIIGGWALRRPTELLNSLATAGFIILLWDPRQLFGASFQLSFFVVLSIALFLPPIQKFRDRLLQVDPLLPTPLVPRWRRALQSALYRLSTPLAVSAAAWLGSLPLCVCYFHLFSPVTLLANLLIVPMSSLALACNMGSLICGNWLPWVTQLLNHSAWFWMRCTVEFSNWCIRVPFAFTYVREFSLLSILVYYLLLIGLLSGWLWAPTRRGWGIAALGIGVGWFSYESYMAYRLVSITILPYNGSLSVYFQSPAKHGNILIDCGASNTVQFVTKPFLRSQGLNRLPALVLTHGDVRHMGGAELLNKLFDVGQVWISPVRFRSSVYRRVIERLHRAPGLVQTLNSSDQLGPWKVLYPRAEDHFPTADDNALILAGELEGTDVLLCSDLSRAGQKALLERKPDLHADVVITGVPTDGEPVSDAFLESVQPQLVIIADADFPVSERAKPKVRERLAKRHIAVVFTRTTGAVTIEFREKRWKLRAMDGLRINATGPGELGKIRKGEKAKVSSEQQGGGHWRGRLP